MLRLDRQSLPRHADPERARRRNYFDVSAFPAHHQHDLEGVAGSLAELAEGDPDRKRVIYFPAVLDDRAGLRLRDPCHRDGATLIARRDPDDVGRVEAELAHRAPRKRQLDVSDSVRRRPRAVKPELHLLRLELGP